MYSAVESAANAEAAEQLYQKGAQRARALPATTAHFLLGAAARARAMEGIARRADGVPARARPSLPREGLQSGEAGNLAMAVRMVEKAARLMPENEAYAAKLSALSRQLKAVYAEQERDQRERGAEGAGDGWSSQRADSERTGRAGPEQDADGFFEERENADESPDRGDGERRSDFLGHKSLAEMWRSVRRTAASLLRARWAMGLGEWSVSFLPRDEERAHRLSYLGHFWLRRLELPLYLGGAALVLRLCFAYPWALFSLGCAACVPLGWLLGRALHVKRAVLAVPLCAHVLFAWQCPYSAASLYCAVGWLAFAAFFRLFALGLTGAVLWLYFLPWTTLYLLLFAVWALATVYEPVALSAVTVAGLGLWSCPVHFTSLGALAFAAVLGWDRSPLALAACAASALIYLRPKVAGRLFAAAALAWGVRRRASLCAWAAGLVGVGEDGGPEPTRPRDGDAAGARAMPCARLRPGRSARPWRTPRCRRSSRARGHAPRPLRACAAQRADTPRTLLARRAVSHVLRASTHYEVLAVAPAASLGQVRSAYKRMALLLHPDKNQREFRARAARPERARDAARAGAGAARRPTRLTCGCAPRPRLRRLLSPRRRGREGRLREADRGERDRHLGAAACALRLLAALPALGACSCGSARTAAAQRLTAALAVTSRLPSRAPRRTTTRRRRSRQATAGTRTSDRHATAPRTGARAVRSTRTSPGVAARDTVAGRAGRQAMGAGSTHRPTAAPRGRGVRARVLAVRGTAGADARADDHGMAG